MLCGKEISLFKFSKKKYESHIPSNKQQHNEIGQIVTKKTPEKLTCTTQLDQVETTTKNVFKNSSRFPPVQKKTGGNLEENINDKKFSPL